MPRNVTLAGVRRLLEEDLELEKHTLDPLKKLINQQVDEVSLYRFRYQPDLGFKAKIV